MLSASENIHDIWFNFYTNYFLGQAIEFASGFEHIFVGEGKYDRRGNLREKRSHQNKTLPGEVSGYYNWVNFPLHQTKKFRRVE